MVNQIELSPPSFLPNLNWGTPNPVKGEIFLTQRRSMYAIDGTLIHADIEPVECFILEGVAAAQGVKILSEKGPFAITLVVNKKEVLVDQKEFALRLGLDPIEMMVAVYQGKLQSYLEEQIGSFVLANHNRIWKNQEERSLAPLDQKCLLAVIKEGLNLIPKGKTGVSFSKIFSWNHPLSPRILGKDIVVIRDSKVRVYDLLGKILFAQGGQSQIYKVEELGAKKSKAFKIFSKNISLAQHEVDILAQLHRRYPKNEKGKRRVPGIQKPFYGAVDLFLKSGNFQHLCEGNLIDLLDTNHNLSTKEKLPLFRDIIFGFEYCVTHEGFIHYDLKLENVFFTSNPLKLYLADFGSAKCCDPKTPQKIQAKLLCTPVYILYSDYLHRRSLADQLNSNTSLDLWKSYIEHCQECDIFALGATLALFLSPQNFVFKYETNGCPIPGSFSPVPLIKEQVPPEICDLIAWMLDSDPKMRPTITQVLNIYDEYLKSLI